MKKILALLLISILALCLLTGCMPSLPLPESSEEPQGTEVLVTVGEVKPGLARDDIWTGIQLNGEGVPCQVEWWYYDEDDTVRPFSLVMTTSENFRGYVDIFYYLPEGVKLGDEDLTVTVDAPNASSYKVTEADHSSDTQMQIHICVEFDLTAGA